MKFDSIDAYVEELGKRVDKVKAANGFGRAAVVSHGNQARRIFVEGKNSSDGKIGNYNSTDPIYIDPDKSPKKFPTKGKTGKSTFKSGKPHKTGFFESYKAFRGKIGRETSFVNLNLFGIMQSSYIASIRRKDQGRLVVWESFLSDGLVFVRKNIRKKEGAEKKFGKIFNLTEKERKEFLDRVQLEYTKTMSGDRDSN